MSLMSMRRKMASRKTANYILYFLIAVFLVGVALWSVPGRGGFNATPQQAAQKSGVIAKVNGSRISADDFEKEYSKMISGRAPDIYTILDARKEVVKGLVQEAINKQAQKSLHVSVSDRMLKEKATESLRFEVLEDRRKQFEEQAKTEAEKAKTAEEKKKLKTAEQLYTDWMTNIVNNDLKKRKKPEIKNTTEAQFIKWYEDYLDRNEYGDRDNRIQSISNSMLGEKWLAKQEFFGDIFAEDYVKMLKTKQVDASWIVITVDGQDLAALDTAQKKIASIRADIVKNPAAFETYAGESNDRMTSFNGGELDWVPEGKLPVLAEYYAYTMKVNSLSPIMLAVYGSQTKRQLAYVILKVNKIRNRSDIKDFNWKKEKETDCYMTKTRYEMELGEECMLFMRQKSLITSEDPEIQYYLADLADNNDKRDKILTQILKEQKTSRKVPEMVMAAMSYKAAMDTKDQKERINYLEDAIQGADNVADLLYKLGLAYKEVKNNDKALSRFKLAYYALKESDTILARNLQTEFMKLKNDDFMNKTKKWLVNNEPKTTPPRH